MKKCILLLVLLMGLVSASSVFASCQPMISSPLTLIISNQLQSNSVLKGSDQRISITQAYADGDNYYVLDAYDQLLPNTCQILSFLENPNYASLQVDVFVQGHNKKQLDFHYDRGVLSDNCAEVFGSYAKCNTTESGKPGEPIYTLTIRNS